MKARVAALISGILFGLGLTVSRMVNPKKVLGFLDVAGQWDPSLLLVMGGGVLVTVLSFPWIQRRGRPLWAERFSLPTRSDIDRNLLLGAALFGIGWAIAGYCPGPAIAALLINPAEAVPFVLAMLLGAWLLAAPAAAQTVCNRAGSAAEARLERPAQGGGRPAKTRANSCRGLCALTGTISGGRAASAASAVSTLAKSSSSSTVA